MIGSSVPGTWTAAVRLPNFCLGCSRDFRVSAEKSRDYDENDLGILMTGSAVPGTWTASVRVPLEALLRLSSELGGLERLK